MAKAARAANRNNAQNKAATEKSEADAKKQLQDIKTGATHGGLGAGEQPKEEQPKADKEEDKQAGGLALVPVDLNAGALPDLDEATIVPLDLSSAYWTPTKPGESKRVYFDCIRTVLYNDPKQGEDVVIDLPTAFFFESKGGQIKSYSNASKRLIACFENNHMERGTPILITYMGKKKNSTNNFLSDDWSVNPLMLKI